jgi:hypothetical protein
MLFSRNPSLRLSLEFVQFWALKAIHRQHVVKKRRWITLNGLHWHLSDFLPKNN